jgi:hypothetical protein
MIQQACNEYNHCTGCNCVGDCAATAQCSCKAAGLYFTSRCHKGRRKNKKCSLNCDLRDQNEDYESND